MTPQTSESPGNRPSRPSEMHVSIPGTPKGQGSMQLMGVGSGGDPKLRYPRNTVDHRNLVIDILRRSWGRPALLSPVAVRATFVFPRPAAHYGTGKNSGVLKPSAPPHHTGQRDTDKLVRLIGDALTIAGVIKDDGQIVAWRAEKRWGEVGVTEVELWTL